MKKNHCKLTCILLCLLMSSACINNDDTQTDAPAVTDIITTEHHDIERTDYTTEEAAEILNKIDKFTASDELIANVPKSLSYISSFELGLPAIAGPQESYDEFMSAFEYLFPGHQYDENCMYAELYTGDQFQYKYDFKTDAEGNIISTAAPFADPNFRKDFFAGKVDNFFVLHYEDDMPYNGESINIENLVCMVARTPLGGDLFMVNKGISRKVMYERGLDNSYGVSDNLLLGAWYAAEGVFEPEDKLSPNSEERFILQDGKEISVKDAVSFFENYLNSMKFSCDPMLKTEVVSVTPYRFFDDDTYILYFQNTISYDGVPFDSIVSGTSVSGPAATKYERPLDYGVMALTDDVDYFYGNPLSHLVKNEQELTDTVSFEEAVLIAAEALTDYIDFIVNRVDLVYCAGQVQNNVSVEASYQLVDPAWRFTLYNSNDALNYICYVDMADGSFTYYTTR